MTQFGNQPFDPATFTGKIRLFPLPNLVMFPHVVQPLHVFEPRYRELLTEALAGDGLIAMAILQPGWEPQYEATPPVYPVACLGQVITQQQTEDGRYYLLLRGVARVRILEELPPTHLFREATALLLPDELPSAQTAQRVFLQQQLLDAIRQLVPKLEENYATMEAMLGGELTLGMLTDVLAYTLDFSLDQKRLLLETTSVEARARHLLAHLGATSGTEPSGPAADSPQFPPDFSLN